MGEQTHPVLQVAIVAFKLHKPDGTEAVKPGVGHLLHQLGKAKLRHLLLQSLQAGSPLRRMGKIANLQHFAADHRLSTALGRDPEFSRPGGNGIDKGNPRLRRHFFQIGGVHVIPVILLNSRKTVCCRRPLKGYKSHKPAQCLGKDRCETG